MKRELIATTTFGLEAVVKREIQELGYEIIKSEDGKITFMGDEEAIARANLWLRCADRVLLRMGEFEAETFEDLYQQTKGIAWEEIIPLDGNFIVTGTSVKSTLHSVPACQKIVKKAIVDRLGDFYSLETLPETGAEYKVKITLLKNRVTLTIDTSGVALHKRGYRTEEVAAPIKETLAAALIKLSFWKKGRLLVDPCCGSGTISIEAALISRNIAPGIFRTFAAEEWDIIDKEIFKKARAEARNSQNQEIEGGIGIYGFDIDTEAIKAARTNANNAGVMADIQFMRRDVALIGTEKNSDKEEELRALWQKEKGIIVVNPPYGERIGEIKELNKIYNSLGSFCKNHQDWSLFLISTDKTVETKVMGRPADRRRKLYNGRLEACYYQYHGEK